MRHKYDSPHLNRTASHRRAMFSNMAASLFIHKKIVTTLGKARYARRFAERMITFARRGEVADRRHVSKFIHNKEALRTLFDDLGVHFKNRNGGYTRLIHLGTRRGDGAPLALIELVGFDDAEVTTTTKKTTKSRLKKTSAEKTSEVQSKSKSKKVAEKPPKKAVEDVATEVTDSTEMEVASNDEVSAEPVVVEEKEETKSADDTSIADSETTTEAEPADPTPDESTDDKNDDDEQKDAAK